MLFNVLIFFVKDTAATDNYTYVHTLSLHGALPSYAAACRDTRSGLEIWTILGAKAVISSRTRDEKLKGMRYSLRPGIAIDGTLTRSPVGSKSGLATVGE